MTKARSQRPQGFECASSHRERLLVCCSKVQSPGALARAAGPKAAPECRSPGRKRPQLQDRPGQARSAYVRLSQARSGEKIKNISHPCPAFYGRRQSAFKVSQTHSRLFKPIQGVYGKKIVYFYETRAACLCQVMPAYASYPHPPRQHVSPPFRTGKLTPAAKLTPEQTKSRPKPAKK